jgi:hypothetical protein
MPEDRDIPARGQDPVEHPAQAGGDILGGLGSIAVASMLKAEEEDQINKHVQN